MNNIFTLENITYFLLAISILLIIIGLTRKVNNFWDFRKIIIEQYDLVKYSKFNIIVSYGVPLLLSIAVIINKSLDIDIINNLNIVLSIFLSMMFAMLSILNNNPKITNPIHHKVLKETNNAIVYVCILCIFTLLISFICLFIGKYEVRIGLQIISAVVYYLMFSIILNIFVIIKRLKILLDVK